MESTNSHCLFGGLFCVFFRFFNYWSLLNLKWKICLPFLKSQMAASFVGCRIKCMSKNNLLSQRMQSWYSFAMLVPRGPFQYRPRTDVLHMFYIRFHSSITHPAQNLLALPSAARFPSLTVVTFSVQLAVAISVAHHHAPWYRTKFTVNNLVDFCANHLKGQYRRDIIKWPIPLGARPQSIKNVNNGLMIGYYS